MTTIYIGIDPGKQGAIAVLYPTGLCSVIDLPCLADMPDVRFIGDYLHNGTDTSIVIERQQAMPKQGVSSTFQTGMGYGALMAVCYLSNHRIYEVRASQWKQKMGLAGKTKEDSRALAIQLFPALAEELKRVKDEGRAESLLIAEYGRRFLT